MKEYHWEVQPMAETEPYFIFTLTDSIAAAAREFEEIWGTEISIRYIRKTAVTDKIDYEEYDVADWQVS